MNLVINKTNITKDDQGRFSLNDLHEASGGLKKHKPALFYRTSSFNSVLNILKVQNSTFEPIVKKVGRYNGGTWVCKELVYKYAMWVNAEFEVNVIQTFDKMMQSLQAPETMQALNELTAKIESDKFIASECGRALNNYKRIKKINEGKLIEGIKSLQLTLGFTKH